MQKRIRELFRQTCSEMDIPSVPSVLAREHAQALLGQMALTARVFLHFLLGGDNLMILWHHPLAPSCFGVQSCR